MATLLCGSSLGSHPSATGRRLSSRHLLTWSRQASHVPCSSITHSKVHIAPASAYHHGASPSCRSGICRSSKKGVQGPSSGNGTNSNSRASKEGLDKYGRKLGNSHLQSNGNASESDNDEPQQVTGVSDTTNKYQEAAMKDEGALHSLLAWDEESQLPKHHTSRRGMLNQVQLSTYADCIGKDIKDLTGFLDSSIKDAIGSIHILPIYPSTGDRGFAPVTYGEVDPAFGTWSDVQALANRYQVCLEFMVNHISPESPQFQDYLDKGAESQYAEMFVRWRDVWPDGAPTADELNKIRTRKPAPPVIEIKLKSGEDVPLWCTFGDQQMDINPFTEEGWNFIRDSLRALCKKGHAKLIRLDAFGYVTKEPGTTCFMQEPAVWELLERIKKVVKPWGVQLLCEVHEDFNLNIELARHGFWVYDFALPLLMIHALQFKTAEPLKNWLSICPRRQITTLDTHDGMGVDDITGLAPLAAVPELEKAMLDRGGNINYKHFYIPPEQEETTEFQAGTRTIHASLERVSKYLKPDCLQGCYQSVPHQYNETYYCALGEDPKSYLLSRAVQFFTPGIPMVYYIGLLAGVNDYELLEKTGGVRDINRHYYTVEEAEKAVQRPVVQALLQLCRFRNSHPAFRGRVYIDDSTPEHKLHVRWYWGGGKHIAVLDVDFQTRDFSIQHTPYEHHTLPADLQALDAVTDTDLSPFSLEFTSFCSLDWMDIETRRKYRHQIIEALVETAASSASNPQPIMSPASAIQGLTPEQIADVLVAEVKKDARGAAVMALNDLDAGASLSMSEDGSDDDSDSESDEPTAPKAPGLQLQHLDLSWAWNLADKPVPSPLQQLAALIDASK